MTGTWQDFRLHPMTLMKMVIEGKATVVGRDDRGRLIYKLNEKEKP